MVMRISGLNEFPEFLEVVPPPTHVGCTLPFSTCRIMKLERMGIADDKIITDLKYMIKKVCRSLRIFFV